MTKHYYSLTTTQATEHILFINSHIRVFLYTLFFIKKLGWEMLELYAEWFETPNQFDT